MSKNNLIFWQHKNCVHTPSDMYLKWYPFTHSAFRIVVYIVYTLFQSFYVYVRQEIVCCILWCTRREKKGKIQEEEKTFTCIFLYYSSLFIQNTTKKSKKRTKKLNKWLRVLFGCWWHLKGDFNFDRIKNFEHFEHLNERKMLLNLRRILDVDYCILVERSVMNICLFLKNWRIF